MQSCSISVVLLGVLQIQGMGNYSIGFYFFHTEALFRNFPQAP